MPFQCSWPVQQQYKCYTHFMCYINRARWVWSFGCLKRTLFLSSTPTLSRDQTFPTVISPNQCLQKLTKTMLNPPVFMKTRGKQKFKRELLSPNTLSRPVKGTVCRELWNQRGNTGWPGFIPMTWTPWHFWQLDTKVNTITPTGPFRAASSQQFWQAHGDSTGTTGQEIQPAQSILLGWERMPWAAGSPTYRAPVIHEGWPQHAPEVCPARAALELHSRGCASCQTERQWPCSSWQSSWGHKSLSNACSVQTWAPATHFRRCRGLFNAPAISF